MPSSNYGARREKRSTPPLGEDGLSNGGLNGGNREGDKGRKRQIWMARDRAPRGYRSPPLVDVGDKGWGKGRRTHSAGS